MTLSQEPDTEAYKELVKKTECLRPFFKTKDPSTYDPIYPSNPKPGIARIAELMNDLYTLFIKMRYIDAEDVAFAPHTTNSISVKTAALFGLDKDVVDLMQMVPYYTGSGPHWNFGSDGGEFLYGGEFDFDMRDEKEADWWLKCVDPLYYLSLGHDPTKKAIGWVSMYDKPGSGEEESEQDDDSDDGNPVGDDGLKLYHRPWHVTLDRLGNHKAVLFVNTRTMKLSETDQEWGNACHFIHDAIPYLEDIIAKFQSLEYIPGGLYEYLYDDWEYRVWKNIYIKAGWPDNFEYERFRELLAQSDEDDKFYDDNVKPLEEFERHVSGMISCEGSRLRYNDAAAQLSALSADADLEKRQQLEENVKWLRKERLPAPFPEWQEMRSKDLEESKSRLKHCKERGDSDDQLAKIYSMIEVNTLACECKSYDEWQWKEYERRRELALKAPDSVRARFLHTEYDVRGLVESLTREDVKEAGMEEYLHFKNALPHICRKDMLLQRQRDIQSDC